MERFIFVGFMLTFLLFVIGFVLFTAVSLMAEAVRVL